MARRLRDARSTDPGQVLTVDEVAAYLQLNRLTVYRYIREGQIPAARIGKLYRVLKPDLDEFLEARKVGERGRAAGRRRHEPAERQRQARVGPETSAQLRRARYSDEAYIGPQWRDQMKEREASEQARASGYPLEWVLRGLH
jgi:excisionase family DNA binding protein